MAPTTNKYTSVITTLNRPLPSWVVDDTDAVRIAAYDAYDDMYRNVPDTFKVVLRGTEDNPIYIPSAEMIVETTNRFLGKDWQWSVNSKAAAAEAATSGQDPSGPGRSEQARQQVQSFLANLFVREEVYSKFYSLKRNMVKDGDAMWHITADPNRAPGERISIDELHPRHYFRIADPGNNARTIGCYLVEVITEGKTEIVRRQEYRKMVTQEMASQYGTPLGGIFYKMTFWELKGWDDRYGGDLKPVAVPEAYTSDPAWTPALQGYSLPDDVKTIPVYHVRNRREGSDPYGVSQIAGIETLIAGINQGASDEDLTLALQGLGVYVTDSARPVNDEGEETDWIIAPGTVLEVRSAAGKFERINGVTSVQPFQDHLDYLDGKLKEAKGLSNVAVGRVDVQVAQSGIALRLELSPILSSNEEKEVELLGRMDQMMHDLLYMWLPAFEQIRVDPLDMTVSNSFADPLPVDRSAVVAEVTTLVSAGLMSKEFAVSYLSEKLGYQFPSDMVDAISQREDAIAARLAGELGLTPGETTTETTGVPA